MLSCSSNVGELTGGAGNPAAAAPPAAKLPGIPQDGPGARAGSALSTASQNGSEAFSFSSGAQVEAPELTIEPAPGSLEWGIYQYHPGSDPLVKVLAHLECDFGAGNWIGVANYGTGRWDFAGPFGTGAASLDNLGGGNHLSPAGNVYLLVAVWDATATNVTSVEFSTDTATVTYGLSGTVTNSAGGAPLAGVSITVQPGNLQTTTDNAGLYGFSGLAADRWRELL
jgi:hypothetical protein